MFSIHWMEFVVLVLILRRQFLMLRLQLCVSRQLDALEAIQLEREIRPLVRQDHEWLVGRHAISRFEHDIRVPTLAWLELTEIRDDHWVGLEGPDDPNHDLLGVALLDPVGFEGLEALFSRGDDEL